MKLRFLRIKYFRSLFDVEIDLLNFQAFVGENNSGKSNILRAMNLLFNPSKKLIDEECFWNLDTSNEISIEGMFTDLTEFEREEARPYLKEEDVFHIKRTVNYSSGEESDDFSDGSVKIGQQNLTLFPIYDWLRKDKIRGENIDRWWENREDLKVRGVSFSEFVGGNKPNVGEWKQFALEFIDSFLDPSDYTEEWVDNPKGYSGVLKSFLPNFIFIPAVQEVTEQAKVTSTSPFGQLIDQLNQNISRAHKNEVNDLLLSIQCKMNREGGDDRIDSVTEIESRINSVLRTYMPVDLEIEFQPPTIDSLLSSPRLYANDGFRNVVENKGHGLQRAIIFSILQSYSELIAEINNGENRTTIFGIEEPEIYMHPQAQRNLRNVFKSIANELDQVFITTHSPNFIDLTSFDEIVRTERIVDNDTVKTKIWQLSIDKLLIDLISRFPDLDGKASTESIRERYSHAYHPNRSEGFFAKKIILVEGATEQYSLPIYAKAMGINLEKMNISIVDCGGKGQIDRLYRIFNELGIPCYVVFDYDKSSSSKNSIDNSIFLLDFFDHDPDPPDSIIITQTLTCFPESFESHVYQGIDNIDELSSEARKTLGLTSDTGKPLVARYVAKKLTSAENPIVPVPIKSLLEKSIEINWSASCLCE